ncbi:hypothetical protein VPH35_061850 [Triticum aestivum]
MHDQVDLDLDGFPLDHEFPEDYGQEEEDECDIEGEPLFEDELANQAAGAKPKRKNIGQDPKTGAEQEASTYWIRIDREFHERKKFPPYQLVSTRGWVSILKR